MPTWRVLVGGQRLSDAWRDLALGAACVGCAWPGRVLCRDCQAALPRQGRPAWPTPTPPGLATPYAAGAYDGLLKALVLEHKEHGAFALARPLGRVLSDVVLDLLRAIDCDTVRETGPDIEHVPRGVASHPVLLVPVPSRPAVVRRRGHDPLLRMTRHAAVRLRRAGVDASVRRLLEPARRVRDQAALDAAARAANLAGSLRCSGRLPVPTPGAGPAPRVLVVDDVLTTGSTAREAQRALTDSGLLVAGIATLAATRRRTAAPPRP